MPIDSRGTVLSFHLHGQGTGVLQTIAIEGSDHTIRVEGHPAFGGKDSAPSPLDYVLGGLAACNQVTAYIVSLGLGIKLGAFDIHLSAELDNSVLVFGAEGNSNFTTVALDITVETDADTATFEKLASEVERRCPLTQLYARSGVLLTSHWTRKPIGD